MKIAAIFLSVMLAMFYLPLAQASRITMYVLNDTGHDLGIFKRNPNTIGIKKDNIPNAYIPNGSHTTLSFETDDASSSIYANIYFESAVSSWPVSGGELYISQTGFNYVSYPADPHDLIVLDAKISSVDWNGKSDITMTADFVERHV